MLPRAARLRKERDFRAVFSRSSARSRPLSTSRMSVHVRQRNDSRSQVSDSIEAPAQAIRFGFTVGKKVAKRAHERNIIRRRLREIVRLDVLPFYTGKRGTDCVIVARNESVGADYWTLRDDLLMLLSRGGLIERRATPTQDGEGA